MIEDAINFLIGFISNRSHINIDEVEYGAAKLFVHADYNQPKFANDIAIIELDNDADRQINNAALCLDTSSAGKSTIALLKNEELAFRFGGISFIDDNQCNEFFQQQFTVLTRGQFCANIHSNRTVHSAFIGGIVLQFDNTKRQYSLKGFTSTAVRAEQAFDESRPYIFTDVEQQLSWINAVIGSSNNTTSSIDEFKPCQLPNDNDGQCVVLEQCNLYRDAPRPFSRQQESLLDQIKCSTDSHSNHTAEDDGICCPTKYINQTITITTTTTTPTETVSSKNEYDFDLDVRFRERRGVELLSMDQCGKVDATRRIVGGRVADLKEFPWQALIKYKVGRVFKFKCGASLISARYTLTCAHCITQLPVGYEAVAVRLGEYDLRTNPDCKVTNDNTGEEECNLPIQDVEIEQLIPHEQYNTPLYSNDIGLVRLAREIQISRNGECSLLSRKFIVQSLKTFFSHVTAIVPICLPINEEKFQFLSDKYTVAGFGYTENGRDSDVLLKIVVPKVAIETCQSFHRSMIQLSEGHTCFGGEGIIDSCKGLIN